jgi:Fic family protein
LCLFRYPIPESLNTVDTYVAEPKETPVPETEATFTRMFGVSEGSTPATTPTAVWVGFTTTAHPSWRLQDDVMAQIGDGITLACPADELAIRFHHRLVIHPFRNGSGRHARLAADLVTPTS